MGNGTKIGLVLVLILGVVVIATVLDRDIESTPSGPEQARASIPEPPDGATGGDSGFQDPSKKPGAVPADPGRDTRRQPGSPDPERDRDPGFDLDRGIGGDPRDLYDPPTNNVALKPTDEDLGKVPEGSFSPAGSDPGPHGTVPAVYPLEDGDRLDPTDDEADDKLAPREVPRPKDPPESKPAPAPDSGFPKVHKVAEGESFWSIAEDYYGAGIRFNWIQDANPAVEAAKMLPGTELTIPAPRSTAKSKPTKKKAETPKKTGMVTHEVRDGDTLYDLAKDRLGDGARWEEIADANPDIDPHNLKIGAKIYIPEK